ncbi:hypothetical protein CEQ31_010420 [Serratia odorifera]|nr:hypothetical protein CEQ31_010420 [Serratia odorifera]RII71036.1 hypothetical protein DX901_15895 [Serratia odorifera]
MVQRTKNCFMGCQQGYSELAISNMMNLPLRCPDYSCLSERAKSVSIPFKNAPRNTISHLVINSEPATNELEGIVIRKSINCT